MRAHVLSSSTRRIRGFFPPHSEPFWSFEEGDACEGASAITLGLLSGRL